MTLLETIRTLETVALRQDAVHTIVENDVFRINGIPSIRYGVFAFTQGQHTSSALGNFTTYGFSLFYVDRLNADRSNQVEIQSTGERTLRNVLQIMENEGFETSDYTIQPFNQRFTDECAGVYCDVRISVPNDSVCPDWVLPEPGVPVHGIPAGGTEGQALTKLSDADYDVGWVTLAEIGPNGNWWIGGVDTGKPSRGPAGPQGERGETGATGEQGPQGAPGKDGAPGTKITADEAGNIYGDGVLLTDAAAVALQTATGLDQNMGDTLAQSECTLESRIAALERLLPNVLSGAVVIPQLQVKELGVWGNNNIAFVGNGAPTKAPDRAGQFYIDASARTLYFSTGNAAISDWKNA